MNISIEPSSYAPLEGVIQAGFGSFIDLLPYLVLVLLLMTSALVSGSEAAFFSLSPSDKEALSSDESKNAQYALRLLEKPRDLLATILITNNFVNVGIVILSNYLLSSYTFMESIHPTLRFLVEVVLITLLLLLLGEVIPKIYANKNALQFTRMVAIPLARLNTTPPVSWMRNLLVLGAKTLQKKPGRGRFRISSDELEQALALTKEDNTSEEEHKILEGIVKFGNTEVRQIMRSRMDIYAIDKKSTFDEVLELILDCGHSRLPVYEESFDNIIGVFFIKDLLPYLNKPQKDPHDWHKLIRKAFFVTENRKIDDLLKDFQEKKVHLAVVVDEYGGTNGIVTLEDVLEEIVGDITDEFDEDEVVYTKVNDNTYIFEGRTSLVDFIKVMGLDSKDIDFDEHSSDTIGGLTVELAGRILKNNEFVEIGNLKIIVESSDKRRVKMVKVVKTNSEQQ